jgi:hypothetical protein
MRDSSNVEASTSFLNIRSGEGPGCISGDSSGLSQSQEESFKGLGRACDGDDSGSADRERSSTSGGKSDSSKRD